MEMGKESERGYKTLMKIEYVLEIIYGLRESIGVNNMIVE